MSKGPCPKKCPGRTESCHATCKTYLAAYEENLKRYKITAQNRKIEDVFSVGVKKRLQAMKKKQKQV